MPGSPSFHCFAKQYSIKQSFSKLSLTLSEKTEKSISMFTLTCNGIAKIICSLDPNKARGRDMISICKLKICGKPFCKPLELIFQSCMKHGKFPNEWKIAKVDNGIEVRGVFLDISKAFN